MPFRVHSGLHGGRHSQIVIELPTVSTSSRISSCTSGGTLAAAYRSTSLAANSTSGRDTMSELSALQAALRVVGDSAGMEP